MVSLNLIDAIDLAELGTILALPDLPAIPSGTASCDKYEGYLYTCIGDQTDTTPDAGINYIAKIDGESFEVLNLNMLNYFANPNGAWFPDPLPVGLDTWGFLNLQGVSLITSNGDGTFKLICPDCYAQAQDSESINPAQDISFPAEIYMDEDLNVSLSLSTFYTAGTYLDTTKKLSDNIGDVTYTNPYDNQVLYVRSADIQERAITPIGLYFLDGLWDINCIDPYCFVVTFDSDLYNSSGTIIYKAFVYLETLIDIGAVNQPSKERYPHKEYYQPSSNKGKVRKVRFGTTFKKSVKNPREITGKSRETPYN